MATIELTGWRVGMRKVSVTKLLQTKAGLPLGQAKSLVDEILEGHQVRVDLVEGDDPRDVASDLRLLGVICEVNDH